MKRTAMLAGAAVMLAACGTTVPLRDVGTGLGTAGGASLNAASGASGGAQTDVSGRSAAGFVAVGAGSSVSLEASGAPFSRAGLLAGARKLSDTSYQSVNTFGISVTPSDFDGASEIRQGTWGSSCSCFEYTSGPIKVS